MKAKRQESSVAPERSTDEATYRVQDVPKHLVITNGDIAAASLLGIGAADEVLAWRDVLHEGPVPATATLAELSAIRAAFIEGAGWSGPDVAADFAARDAVLLANDAFETVTLWFEHDLYDQLQLIQILDWFATHPRRDPASLRLVAADTYLGEMSHEQLADLARVAAPVSDAELDLGRRAWQAFRAPSPEPVAVLAAALAARAPMAPDEARSRRDDDGVATGSAHPLPHLCAALARMLDELPDARTGLSLTEATILRLIRDGVTRPVDIFVALGDRESARFMGDLQVYATLDRMAAWPSPLIDGLPPPLNARHEADERKRYLTARLRVTLIGAEVMTGHADNLAHNAIDRWWGGTHLTKVNAWRFDRNVRRLIMAK